jgi:hypothetical protein
MISSRDNLFMTGSELRKRVIPLKRTRRLGAAFVCLLVLAAVFPAGAAGGVAQAGRPAPAFELCKTRAADG